MNRSESKYFNTAIRMDKAFLELLEKKNFAYITVKEICEMAGVNRSTFYLHYETIGDLLAESSEYIIKQFTDFMPHNTINFLKKIPTCSLDELYLITPEYLVPYLTYIKAHKRIFRVTVEQASTLQMVEAYKKLNCHVFVPILKRFNVPENAHNYMMSFYISGLMAIINEWLKEDCKDSIEHIISMIQMCICRQN